MAPASISPPPSDRSEGKAQDERETYGALGVERHAKDDGRSLILYTQRTSADAETITGRERAGT
jgi:hypothetical protein